MPLVKIAVADNFKMLLDKHRVYLAQTAHTSTTPVRSFAYPVLRAHLPVPKAALHAGSATTTNTNRTRKLSVAMIFYPAVIVPAQRLKSNVQRANQEGVAVPHANSVSWGIFKTYRAIPHAVIVLQGGAMPATDRLVAMRYHLGHTH